MRRSLCRRRVVGKINILRGRGYGPALDQRGELRFSPLETPSLTCLRFAVRL